MIIAAHQLLRRSTQAFSTIFSLTTINNNPSIMKTKFKTIRLLLATFTLGALASFAYAGSGSPQYGDHLTSQAQFKQLHTGDKIAYVCSECKTTSEITIKSPEHAMELCKEGAAVMCPSCKKSSKVVVKGERNDAPTHTEITYVNDKGEECAFVAKVAERM